MAVRRLYEPLCIAFGTTVSSPTVPTYQLYDLPHKFTPRLYMESEDPNLVLREIGVWAGWEQAGSANTRSFLLDLLKDKGAHGNFLLREAGPTRFRRVRGIIVLTQKHLRIVQTKGSRLGGLRFQLWRWLSVSSKKKSIVVNRETNVINTLVGLLGIGECENKT